MLKIAVCDDDVVFASKIEKMLLEYEKKYNMVIEIEIYNDGVEVEKALNLGQRFDLLYLDIEMNQKDGLITSKIVREIDKVVKIIYVTSYENYAISVFDYQPFQFIIKPINETIFERYFLQVCREILQDDHYFQFKFNKSFYKISYQDIVFFESQKRTFLVHTENNINRFYGRLNDVEKQIKNEDLNFLRIHQSFLVNYKYIYEISYDEVKLTNGMILSISEDRRKKVSKQFCVLIGRQGKWIL